MINFVLTSLPPTSNHRLAVGGTGRMFKTKEYRIWQQCAIHQIREQVSRGQKPLEDEVKVLVRLVFPDNRKRDIDNPLKPINDILTQSGVISDDSRIKRQYVQGLTIKGQQRVIISIWEKEENSPFEAFELAEVKLAGIQ